MAGDAADGTATDGATFAIPAHPVRRYPYDEGVRYEGGSVFRLTPTLESGTDAGEDSRPGGSDPQFPALVREVLAAGPYRYGDFLDLPMPLYLVRDDETADVFRVSVRDGSVRLHVLPETGPEGLRAFYDRLVATSDRDWTVDCRTGDPQPS